MINQKYVSSVPECFLYVFGRMIHVFTCAGIIAALYQKLCQIANFGSNGKWYIRLVYKSIDLAFTEAK
jgi:hypothetical protein